MDNEERRENTSKKNTILLTVIGVATLLVALVGATFAYFTATLTGNPENNNVNIQTDTYGLTVAYEDGKDSVSILNANLPQSEMDDEDDTNYPQDEINFKVTSDSNSVQSINVGFAEGFTNTFCQTVAVQTDADCAVGGEINVADEIYYELYTCDSDYTTNCTLESSGAMPYSAAQPAAAVVLKQGISVPANGTTYMVFKSFIKNKELPQNYNQSKEFAGKLWVSENVTP